MMARDDSAEAFEYFLSRTKPFGYFQKRLFFLTSLLQAFCWTNVIYLDILHQHAPEHTPYRCEDEPSIVTTVANITTTTNSTNGTTTATDILLVYNEKQSSNGCENENVSPSNWTLPGWMTRDSEEYEYVWFAQVVGLVIGALFSGFLGDRFGRKNVTFFMFGCMTLSHGAVAISPKWLFFMASRASVGFFASGFMVCSTVLVVEHVGKHWRDATICACLWILGVALITLPSILIRNWRYLAISSAVLPFPLTGFYFMFPESFRWYGVRQRFSDSEAAIREVTSCNTSALSDLIIICDNARIAVINNMHRRTHTFMDLIHSRFLLKYSVSMSICMFLSCGVYRCLLERMCVLTGNSYVDLCLSYCIDLPVIYSALIINKCIGRRWCLFLFATSSGCALMCILVLHINNNLDEDKQMVTSISVFGKMGVAASMSLITLISIETYPTAIRCMGVSLCVVSGVCGFAVGRHMFRVLKFQNLHYTLPFIGYGTLMAAVGFLSLVQTDTSSTALPDLLPSKHRIIATKDSVLSTRAWDTIMK